MSNTLCGKDNLINLLINYGFSIEKAKDISSNTESYNIENVKNILDTFINLDILKEKKIINKLDKIISNCRNETIDELIHILDSNNCDTSRIISKVNSLITNYDKRTLLSLIERLWTVVPGTDS